MRLRSAILVAFALLGTLILVPLAAQAQPAGKVYRIGYLSPGPATDQLNSASMFSAFRQGLRDLGYVEGQNLVIESRYADGETDRLSSLAAELVRLKVATSSRRDPESLLPRAQRPRSP